MKRISTVLGLCTAVVISAGTSCAPVADDLTVGDPAPAFDLPGTDGKRHTLAKLKGKTVVLAWFPKAFTSG